MEILPKLTRFRINGLEISSFYTLDNVLDKEKENIFQTPQGTVCSTVQSKVDSEKSVRL